MEHKEIEDSVGGGQDDYSRTPHADGLANGFVGSSSGEGVATGSAVTDDAATSRETTTERNGFHPHLSELAAALEGAPPSTAQDRDGAPPSPTQIGAGAFGFDASKLKKSRDEQAGGETPPMTRDAIAVDDEEELRGAKNLLLRDHSVADSDLCSRG